MNLLVEISLPVDKASQARVRRVEAGQSSWKFSTDLEDGELFYRTKLQGTFTLSGADYAWLYSFWDEFPCCAQVNLNVFIDCPGQDQEIFWPGYFTFDSVKWNHYKCTATVNEVKPRDSYDALYRVWDKQVNLLEGFVQRTRFSAKYPDSYSYEFNDKGETIRKLPDGNEPAIDKKGTHIYTQGIELGYALNNLHGKCIYGSAAGFIPGIASELLFSNINPITGNRNPRFLVMAGSDAKRPKDITPAKNLFTTLKEFIESLRGMFDLYYYIDPFNGTLRLEHSSWFDEQKYTRTNAISLDLLPHLEVLDKANNESVDTSELFGIEELIISLNPNEGEFRRGNVRFEDQCLVRYDKGEVKTNTVTVDRIFTDLTSAYLRPESISDDSIFMVAIRKVEDNQIGEIIQRDYDNTFLNPGVSDGLNSPNPITASFYAALLAQDNNTWLSAATLYKRFHRHRKSFVRGTVNSYKNADGSYTFGEIMTMTSTKPTRRQEAIVLPICCADLPLNIKGYIRTNRIELGKMRKGVFDPNAETITFDVVTNSRCEGDYRLISPSAPGEGCPPEGTPLGEGEIVTYCPPGFFTVATKTKVQYFANGNCGKIERIVGQAEIVNYC